MRHRPANPRSRSEAPAPGTGDRAGFPRRSGRAFHPRGFTLVEALIAATILGVVASGAMLPFVAGVQHVEEAVKLERAVMLGQAMMEEVLARTFYEPGQSTPTLGPESWAGESDRSEFDSIDDFHNFSETGNQPSRFNNGTIYDPDFDTNPDLLIAPEFDGFWRSVTTTYVSFPGQASDDTNSFIRIEVKVYFKTALLVTLSRIVAREY